MTSTALPDEAFNTEFHSGDVQLWVTPDAADVYLVGEDRIERWEADSGACA